MRDGSRCSATAICFPSSFDGFVVDDGRLAKQAPAAKSPFWVVAETVGFGLRSRECFFFSMEVD
jgi:hypothetical protein